MNIAHRDRDYMTDSEADEWGKEILQIGAEPFVTAEIDVEGYFSNQSYITPMLPRSDSILKR